MKVETNSPTRERIQRTSRKMLSADDWAFQWNIDPNTARSMAYKGIPKVKNSESVNTTSSQCPLRTCIPPGKIEKKGVVMVAVPKKKKPRILMMQVTKKVMAIKYLKMKLYLPTMHRKRLLRRLTYLQYCPVLPARLR